MQFFQKKKWQRFVHICRLHQVKKKITIQKRDPERVRHLGMSSRTMIKILSLCFFKHNEIISFFQYLPYTPAEPCTATPTACTSRCLMYNWIPPSPTRRTREKPPSSRSVAAPLDTRECPAMSVNYTYIVLIYIINIYNIMLTNNINFINYLLNNSNVVE